MEGLGKLPSPPSGIHSLYTLPTHGFWVNLPSFGIFAMEQKLMDTCKLESKSESKKVSAGDEFNSFPIFLDNQLIIKGFW